MDLINIGSDWYLLCDYPINEEDWFFREETLSLIKCKDLNSILENDKKILAATTKIDHHHLIDRNQIESSSIILEKSRINIEIEKDEFGFPRVKNGYVIIK
jgi:hypothetical protein